jgi:hypothetical protein
MPTRSVTVIGALLRFYRSGERSENRVFAVMTFGDDTARPFRTDEANNETLHSM